MSLLRRVFRAAVSPFRTASRFDQLVALVERRMDSLERGPLRTVLDRQQQLEQRLEGLTREQERLRRVVAGEELTDDDRAREPFRGPLPATVEPVPESAWVDADSDCPPKPIERLTACPVCGETARTAVCHYNKMITMAAVPDAAAAIYDYALCHRCGVVYATRRPAGARFAWLLEHFEESLGRAQMGVRRGGKLTLSSYELDDAARAQLRALAAHGVFVSEHKGLTPKAFLWQLQSDRFANSRHVELLGSLLPLKAPRVLEIRSRLGSISEGLRRLHGARVQAMAMFPNQRFLIQEVYGIRADAPLDFDRFTVPYDPPFDLIVANHMVTHSIRPGEFLASVRDALAPGGHVYFFNEPLEDEFLRDEKSMFNTLNAFHLQTFNRESFVRAIRTAGFDVVHVGREGHNLFCLARKADGPLTVEPMPEAEARQRRVAYRRAYDLSIVLLPEHARPRFADVWEKTLERVKDRGLLAEDARGRLRVMRAVD
ncbi:MAG: methyltransferase domain-containing protein [Vicinamibacterales bacterium]